MRFASCCDTDAERARAWAARYGAERTYASLAALLEAESPPAVLLATWPNLHRAQIETCLAAGVRNILCEKALAVTGAEASEIYDLAHAAGAFVMEGFMYRQHPAIRTIEQRIAAGAVGEVDYVRAVFYALQLDNFAQAAAGRAQPVVPPVQSVVNVYVTEALNTSLLERRSVDIDLPEPIAADYRALLANRRNE